MIQVLGLTKRYGGRTAVADLSFEVRSGHVTGFLGPNGSGKSTTMRMILGLDQPDAGHARINGAHYGDLPWPLREVGALLEPRAVHPGRSAFHHLLSLAQANAIAPARVTEVLDVVGLAGVSGRRAGTFSLGMAQRLGMAAALIGDPGVLLLDEPVNGLDPDGILWVRTLLEQLASEGRTVLVSSHLIAEMALCADRIVVIGKGRLIAETSVADLIANSPGGYVKVRTPAESQLVEPLRRAGARVRRIDDGSLAVEGLDAAAIATLAAARGILLHELAVHDASLEEAYLDLTRSSKEFQATGGGPRVSDGDHRWRTP